MINHLTTVLKPSQVQLDTQGSCIVHYDNAPCHNSRICSEELIHTPFVRLPHPPYSPDIAVCDFYLFGKLKQSLQQVRISNREELEEEIDRIMKQISKEEWKRVFNEWLTRLRWIVENNGEYYRKERMLTTQSRKTTSPNTSLPTSPLETLTPTTPPSPNTSLPTSPLGTLTKSCILNTSSLAVNTRDFPQLQKLGYYREDELKDGTRIYRCAHTMCGYYSVRKNNVTRHYKRKHFYNCTYPKCSFSTEFEAEFINHLWMHNSTFASSKPTDSQTQN